MLGGADQVLSDQRKRDPQRSEKQLAAKDNHMLHLEEVTTEMSMEVLQLKKAWGDVAVRQVSFQISIEVREVAKRFQEFSYVFNHSGLESA